MEVIKRLVMWIIVSAVIFGIILNSELQSEATWAIKFNENNAVMVKINEKIAEIKERMPKDGEESALMIKGIGMWVKKHDKTPRDEWVENIVRDGVFIIGMDGGEAGLPRTHQDVVEVVYLVFKDLPIRTDEHGVYVGRDLSWMHLDNPIKFPGGNLQFEDGFTQPFREIVWMSKKYDYAKVIVKARVRKEDGTIESIPYLYQFTNPTPENDKDWKITSVVKGWIQN